MSLDDAIDYLGRDELLEITPKSLRIRKKVLKHDVRQKTAKKARTAKS
jgi:GTP-binding protein